MSELLTPSQTVGPYFSMRLPWPEGPYVVPAVDTGAVTIYGRLYDGAGAPIPDGLIETWQADPACSATPTTRAARCPTATRRSAASAAARPATTARTRS